ncbi:FAD-binding oxidoreductase [Candidatus Kaiserbacteria bacterium]|nr:FAD-binding oxidoreductase [Candidatus Kaiserbacteria bacterium]
MDVIVHCSDMGATADELRGIGAGSVDDSKETLEKYSRDASLFRVLPSAVIQPQNAGDVEKIVAFVLKKKSAGEAISVTARSGGTDMSGGPLNDSIILDMRALNHLLELGDQYAVVEPGMYFRDFDKETKKKNLELPSYTASREICTVGGMVANNSGGEKNLKYGKTARYVEELDVVLSDGKVHTLKNLEGEALKVKLAEQSFEGDVYRAVSKLIRENRKTIEEGKPHVEKNSSGYALWDMGDPDASAGAGGVPSLNLARLMVGAQGTLGLITSIRFGLVHPKPYASMLVIFLKDLKGLGHLVPEVLKHDPDSFESYDDHTFSLAIKYFPEFAAQMKTGIIRLGLSLLPEMWMLLSGGIPKLVLMVEFRADEQAEALANARVLSAAVLRLGLGNAMHIEKDEHAARKYWTIRRESFNLLRKKVRGMRTAPFIDDFVVPPFSLGEFLPKLTDILSHYDLVYTIAGHVGDGNFHIIPLMDPTRPDGVKIIEELSHKVYDLVLSYHGSISGEHNDGLVRTPYVAQMFGAKMEKLFEEIKKIFDPLNIFNPGKKVGMSFARAQKYLDLSVK